MKKNVLLMAGLLGLALAGSAQAATMFAVQNAGAVDQFTVSDTGMVNAGGAATQVGGAFGGQLSKVPAQVGGAGATITGPVGVFHVASQGAAGPSAAFLAQHVTDPQAPNGSTFGAGVAPTFSFYRINKYDAGGPVPNGYVLPLATHTLGAFQFGTVNTAIDPNLGTSRVNAANFVVKAESDWTSLTNTPAYFAWLTAPTGAAYTERMRLSSTGNLGIGTTAPTSKLQVVGLQTEPSPGVVPTGLTSGAFYKTAAGVVMVAP